MVITQSGLYNDERGQRFQVTQGLNGYTLVAGKQCLFRIRLDQTLLDEIENIFIRVKRTDGAQRTYYIVLPKGQLIIDSASPDDPNIGIIIRGVAFPRSGIYDFSFIVRASDHDLLRLSTGQVCFFPTKDLLLNVVFGRHEGFFEPTIGWYVDLYTSMRRLGSMFPVRDGVGEISPDSRQNGIRYMIGNPCDGWKPNYYSCVYDQTRQFNNSSVESFPDQIHVTVEFRWGFYTPGDSAGYDPNPGGNAGRPPLPYSDLRRASAVGGVFPPNSRRYITAPLIAQEIGHNFGLESPNSPHYDGESHSEDPEIDDPYKAFDFVRERAYYPPQPGLFLGDIMSWAWNQGNNSTLFNTYDWEQLRSEFMNLPSTGSDINPNYLTEIEPSKIKVNEFLVEPQLSTKQEYYEKSLRPAEGYQWEWTLQGLQSIKPAVLDKRSNQPISDRVHNLLAQLAKDKADIVYLPIGNRPLTIAGKNIEDTYNGNVNNMRFEKPDGIESWCS